MTYRLTVLKAAADIAEAYNYYEAIKQGLGNRFLEELLLRLNEIKKHLQYDGFIEKQHIIRDVKLKKFPYLIVMK